MHKSPQTLTKAFQGKVPIQKQQAQSKTGSQNNAAARKANGQGQAAKSKFSRPNLDKTQQPAQKVNKRGIGNGRAGSIALQSTPLQMPAVSETDAGRNLTKDDFAVRHLSLSDSKSICTACEREREREQAVLKFSLFLFKI